MFKGGIGWPEVLIILAVLLLLFGAKRLPEMGRSLGKSMREFRSATKGLGDDVRDGLEDDRDLEEEAAAPRAKGRAKDAAE